VETAQARGPFQEIGSMKMHNFLRRVMLVAAKTETAWAGVHRGDEHEAGGEGE